MAYVYKQFTAQDKALIHLRQLHPTLYHITVQDGRLNHMMFIVVEVLPLTLMQM